jgi:hypothetical protein
VAICWPKGLPQHRDECWYLMTDLAYSVHELTKLYARRMTVEELFRDAKNRRHGWGLRDTLITRGDLYHHSCQLVGALATDSCIGVP